MTATEFSYLLLLALNITLSRVKTEVVVVVAQLNWGMTKLRVCESECIQCLDLGPS